MSPQEEQDRIDARYRQIIAERQAEADRVRTEKEAAEDARWAHQPKRLASIKRQRVQAAKARKRAAALVTKELKQNRERSEAALPPVDSSNRRLISYKGPTVRRDGEVTRDGRYRGG